MLHCSASAVRSTENSNKCDTREVVYTGRFGDHYVPHASPQQNASSVDKQ